MYYVLSCTLYCSLYYVKNKFMAHIAQTDAGDDALFHTIVAGLRVKLFGAKDDFSRYCANITHAWRYSSTPFYAFRRCS